MSRSVAILEELMRQVDSNNAPQVDSVTKKLNELAYSIPAEGPESLAIVLENGGYAVVCRAWLFICFTDGSSNTEITHGAKQCGDAVLRALGALTKGNPEIIDDVGWQIVIQAIEPTVIEETQILAMKVLRNLFIKHEENRDHFCWELNMLGPLMTLISISRLSGPYLQEFSSVLISLIHNDDLLYACNRAGERKRAIVKARVLPALADCLRKPEYEQEVAMLNAIVYLLGRATMNEDVATQVDQGNVLAGIHNIFRKHVKNKILMRNTIYLLKSLCTSPEIKDKVGSLALMKWVAEILFLYLDDQDLVETSISCIACMTLKNACLASQFIAKNGLETILQVMIAFPKKRNILKLACLIIRNLADKNVLDGKQKVKDAGYQVFFQQVLTHNEELRTNYIQPLLNELSEIPEDRNLDQDRPHSDIPIEPYVGRKSLVVDDFVDD